MCDFIYITNLSSKENVSNVDRLTNFIKSINIVNIWLYLIVCYIYILNCIVCVTLA